MNNCIQEGGVKWINIIVDVLDVDVLFSNTISCIRKYLYVEQMLFFLTLY